MAEITKIETTQTLQKFIIDRNESLSDGKSLSYHRNGMFQSIKNTEIFAVNEPANLECVKLPNEFFFGRVGLVEEGQHLIMTGNNKKVSEIGILDLNLCTYTEVINNSCLNFRKTNNPITGAVRLNSDGEIEVILVDGTNSDRLINLSNLPFKYTIDEFSDCKEKVFTDQFDCDALNLNPNIAIACLDVKKGSNGTLPDGVYFVSIAYNLGEDRFTDYMNQSLPVQINNESGSNSISISISNLDRNFERYQVLLTGIVKGITTHKIIGRYYTSQTSISITDWVNDEYQDGIPSTELTVRKSIYDRTGILNTNSETLFRADVKRKSKINYQKQAFEIKAKYVVKQVPLDYYKDDGADIGYFRNEIVRLFVRWYHTDGEVTDHFHICGPDPTGQDLGIAQGNDKFEKEVKFNYELYNTASRLTPRTDPINNIIGFGKTGFWRSTEKYPDIPAIYGDKSCTFITDHMIPDEEKVPRYQVINEEIFLNIIGLQFENVEHPKDENGKYVEGISHYEIIRCERDEQNSRVIARGVITNMGGFKDTKGKNILYGNFPFNDVTPNNYLSQTQTWKKNNKENNFTPLNTFYSDKFSFYTPHGNYFGRKSLAGTYMHFESVESGETRGYFEEPFKHPKHKLLTNFALLISATIGAIEALQLALGSKKTTKNQNNLDQIGTTTGTSIVGTVNSVLTGASIYPTVVTTFEENFLSIPRWREDIKTTPPSQLPLKLLLNTLKTVIALGLFVFKAAEFAANVIKAIKDFSEYQQYARQYNSEVIYNTSQKILKGNKRRKFLRQPFYMNNGIHSVGDLQINNGGRNSTIFLETENDVPLPVGDNSRRTMSQFGLSSKDTRIVTSKSSVYYVSIMKNNPNQYGTIENSKVAKMHTCPLSISEESKFYVTPVLFGGDCILAEQTHVNKFPLFRQSLSNTEFPDGMQYDYRLYNNVGYSRFWIDTTDYDMGNILNIFGKSRPTIAKLPNQKFNMDLPNVKTNEWIERDQVFYTSVNGVIRYIAEVPYNISYRKEPEEINQPHYSTNQTDLSLIFRADLQAKKEGFELDPSYKYLSQTYISSLQFNKIPKINEREENTVLYSLPYKSDFGNGDGSNWRYFLPLNRFTFDRRDFGKLTGIHSLDQDRVLFLFSKASPFISPGRSVLELKNQTVTIGDGGIFAQVPRELLHTDIAYGSNHDRYAFSSTQFGPFYVSEHQGKIFQFQSKLNEITREGWHKWAAEYIPIQLKKQFPQWEGIHNPINGVGYQIVFDNIFETVYFIKKDYFAKEGVTFNLSLNRFEFNSFEVLLSDPIYFEDCSLTLSYNPALESFQSFHDWHPDAVIQEERHFSTIKDNTVWKHNIRTDLFCNFYGKDYPYQLGITQSQGQNVSFLQSVEYMQEAYIYKNLDRYHAKDQTFDWAMIYNSEQHSGLLHLNNGEGIRYEHEQFPKFNGNHSCEIPFAKVEQKYRFNMFYDYTKDRKSLIQPFITKKNGYDFFTNPAYINFQQQRPPRFRHAWNSIWFSKEKCNNIQLITKFTNCKLTYSFR